MSNKIKNSLLDILYPDAKVRKRIEATFCKGNESYSANKTESDAVILYQKLIDKCDELSNTSKKFKTHINTLNTANLQNEISTLISNQIQDIAAKSNGPQAQIYKSSESA